jgi:hypothetical protein
MNEPSSIHLHIDELVLEGFPESTRRRVTDALTSELRGLLTDKGLPSVWQMSVGRIDAGTIRLSNANGAGKQIAAAVYGGKVA